MLKIKTASDHLFTWTAPDAVLTGTTPTLTVLAGGVAVAGIPAMQAITATQTVSAIAADRTTITLNAAVDTGDAGAAQNRLYGDGFILSGDDRIIPVRIVAIDLSDTGTQVTLAEPLPRTVSGSGSSLQWATWWTVFTSADVTATARRDVTWEIEYTPVHAGSSAAEATDAYDRGRIAIVNRPFDTGLTTARLARAYSELGQAWHRRNNDRQAIIDEALADLILDVRLETCPRGKYEDDLNGEHFVRPHILLTAALAFDAKDPERAERLREQYEDLLKKALQCAWLDDGDGVPEDGEDQNLSGPPALQSSRFSDQFTGTYQPTYRRKQNNH